MKISKEFKTGLIVILAIAILIAGVNFLKGDNFFGGSPEYYAVFEESGYLEPSSAVTLNGVAVGTVKAIYNDPEDLRRVIIRFSITKEGLELPKGSIAEITSTSLLSKGLILKLDYEAQDGFHTVGDTLIGSVAPELTDAVTAEVLPIKEKLERLMSSVENMVVSVNAFWDTTAAQSLDGSLLEVKIAIARFGNLAKNLDEMVIRESSRLTDIFQNVESISANLKASNEKISNIIGNVSNLTDTLVTADFAGVIKKATTTLETMNTALKNAAEGNGTLGKLLYDEQLYNELVNTNKSLQELVEDIELHPEKYIHFSVFGKSEKGVKLTKSDEEKLRELLKEQNNK
ncbi:MlaD family protein [Wandonia haliotis]|uniref:MlaD family protein n=1 Tax=Wandonia haliotis TaxID=574963 RepID=A0ABP3Y0V5_9FLAO